MTAISANYPMPVFVNGYLCNNCTQVAEAQKDINPADPQAGPWGIDGKTSSTATHNPAFTLGGLLASGSTKTPAIPPSARSSTSPTSTASSPPPGPGGLLNISV
jgi:hypothetical protein